MLHFVQAYGCHKSATRMLETLTFCIEIRLRVLGVGACIVCALMFFGISEHQLTIRIFQYVLCSRLHRNFNR